MVQDTTGTRNELPADRLWKIDEVAAYLRVSPNTIRNRMEDSGFPYEKVGHSLRFRRDAVDAWLAEQNEATEGAA